MAFDFEPPAATTRLEGTLRQEFSQFATYLASAGNADALNSYLRLARAITAGIIPYIDGRDDLLDKKITVERKRNDEQDVRIAALEARIGGFQAQLSALVAALSALR